MIILCFFFVSFSVFVAVCKASKEKPKISRHLHSNPSIQQIGSLSFLSTDISHLLNMEKHSIALSTQRSAGFSWSRTRLTGVTSVNVSLELKLFARL